MQPKKTDTIAGLGAPQLEASFGADTLAEMRALSSAARAEAQRRNMDALIETQRSAAMRCQDLFERELARFQRTLEAMERNASTQDVYETVLANAQTFVENAKRADDAAQSELKDRVAKNARAASGR